MVTLHVRLRGGDAFYLPPIQHVRTRNAVGVRGCGHGFCQRTRCGRCNISAGVFVGLTWRLTFTTFLTTYYHVRGGFLYVLRFHMVYLPAPTTTIPITLLLTSRRSVQRFNRFDAYLPHQQHAAYLPPPVPLVVLAPVPVYSYAAAFVIAFWCPFALLCSARGLLTVTNNWRVAVAARARHFAARTLMTAAVVPLRSG